MSTPPARLMLKPAQLRLIQQIAEHGQLQRAAEITGMTQPAASRMLAEAESQVGAQLFLRQPKGMEPTEIGRAVLRRVNAILREMYSLAADVSALRVALDQELSEFSAPLAGVREVAFFPPMTGG